MRPADLDLNRLKIASPCSADWAAMDGDERARFCGACEKNVYDLSAMTEAAARALVVEKEGNLCVRLRRRADGTVISGDCPVGWRRLRRARRRVSAAVTGVLGVMFGFLTTGCRPSGDAASGGAPLVVTDPGPEVEMGDVLMGEVEAAPAPAPEAVMGRVCVEPNPRGG